MSRKQKKKDAREQSTRQLMGIDDIMCRINLS